MRKFLMVTSLFLLSFCANLFGQSAQRVIELNDALANGSVSLVTASGKGSSTGFSVDGYLNNNTSSEIRINVHITNGLYLINSGRGQNMVAAQVYIAGGRYSSSGNSVYIRLPANERTSIVFRAFCANIDLDSPTANEHFSLASVPSDIRTITGRINRFLAANFDNDDYLDLPVQIALWRSQGHTRSKINQYIDFDNSDWEVSSNIMIY